MNMAIMVVRLAYEPDSDNFEAIVAVNDQTYNLRLADFSEQERDSASKLSGDICSWVHSNLATIKEFCAARLLHLKNEVWLQEGEQPLSQQSFAAAIELNGMLAFSEGSFEMYFNDNDIFGGHTILVGVTKEYVLDNAQLAG